MCQDVSFTRFNGLNCFRLRCLYETYAHLPFILPLLQNLSFTDRAFQNPDEEMEQHVVGLRSSEQTHIKSPDVALAMHLPPHSCLKKDSFYFGLRTSTVPKIVRQTGVLEKVSSKRSHALVQAVVQVSASAHKSSSLMQE
jgi:hypothetical protein